jgi:large subunit ribosomal protein L13
VPYLNVEKIKITEKKASNKKYTSYSGYPGGQKIMDINMMIEKYGVGEVVKRAVYKMLPKNRLQSRRIKLLKIKA